MKNLTEHEEDFNVSAERYFRATTPEKKAYADFGVVSIKKSYMRQFTGKIRNVKFRFENFN